MDGSSRERPHHPMSEASDKQAPAAQLHVAYLGPEASFSHQAALALFPPTQPAAKSTESTPSSSSSSPLVTLHHLPSFSSIFSSLQNSSQPPSPTTTSPARPSHQIYDYAVIPIENSTNGSVVQVLDLLSQSGLVHQSQSPSSSPSQSESLYSSLSVCAEYYLPVHHCLYIHPGNGNQQQQPLDLSTAASSSPGIAAESTISQISTLYTHPQVWGQCNKFLSRHHPPPHVERIDVGSTSAAAALVAREGSQHASGRDGGDRSAIPAAICSKLAGEKHGLRCLAENIEDEVGLNTTRFLVLRNEDLHQRLGPGVERADSSTTPSDWKLTYHHQLISRRWTSTPTTSSLSSPAMDPTPSAAAAPVRHKSLITFTIPHRQPGSLADALAVFKRYGFNLTSIDTRPSRRRNWQYVFFVECEEADPETWARQGPEPRTLDDADNTHPLTAATTFAPDEDEWHADDSGHVPDTRDNLRRILLDLRLYTESLRYVGRFVDQLQE